MQVEQIHAVMY